VEAVFPPENFRIFSDDFLQDPVAFPLLSCRILRDPVAVIFDLGTTATARSVSVFLIIKSKYFHLYIIFLFR